MQDDTPGRWLRLSVVAKRLGISHESARVLVVTGELAARRPTGKKRGMYQVHEDVLASYEASTQSAQPA